MIWRWNSLNCSLIPSIGTPKGARSWTGLLVVICASPSVPRSQNSKRLKEPSLLSETSRSSNTWENRWSTSSAPRRRSSSVREITTRMSRSVELRTMGMPIEEKSLGLDSVPWFRSITPGSTKIILSAKLASSTSTTVTCSSWVKKLLALTTEARAKLPWDMLLDAPSIWRFQNDRFNFVPSKN